MWGSSDSRVGAILMALAVGGCSSGGDGGPAQGSLSVSLMDGPVDDVSEVHVQIEALWIKPKGDGPAVELPLGSPTMNLDLLELETPESAALLIDDAEVAAGEYDWLAMDVNAEFDGIFDSYVVTKTGGQEEVRVPSGRIRLVSGFEVGPNEAVAMLFDWSMRHGLVDPPGQPGYLLKPAFRALDVTEYLALQGTVALTTIMGAGCQEDGDDYDVGNVVYVYQGIVAPDDIDGAGDPIATADVTQNSAGDYVYRVILLPGEYTAAFTCQAGNDEPEAEDTLEFSVPVNVTMTTASTTADF
jgi:hypothetical protein